MIRREPQIIFNINSAFAKTVMGKLLITKGIYLAIVSLIIMATVLVCVADASGSSTSVCGNGGRGIFNLGGPTCKRTAQIQGFPVGCELEIDVFKRDSSVIDFIVCVKKKEICTSHDVEACSRFAQHCEPFEPEALAKLFPKACAEVCVEPSTGDQCLYTDIEYKTCSKARTMDENEICITLSNGEEECSEIPQELLAEMMLQNAKEAHARINSLPQFSPHMRD